MKINYKKIASVLASTVMLGSTVAFASAAFPAPFVNSGVEDAAIVIGASAAESDNLAAVDLGASLDKSITATTGGVISGEGDKVKIEKGSNKLSLSNTTSGVWGTAITDSDLKTLLADGVFNNKQNSEYKYEQKFNLGAMTFTHFSDSDYQDKLPTLGFQLASGAEVANYTLDFVTDPESSGTTDLTDFETKNIEMLGKNYYILDFKNSSTPKITFLDAATTSSLAEDEKKTLTVGEKTYEVAISFITSDEVILNVNGVDTEKLSATGTTYGNTYKLSDGTYVGIKTVNVQNYAGGTKSVDFSLGKGKLEVVNGSNVKINDKSVDDLIGYVYLGVANSKTTWQKLVMEWKLSDENFLTPGKELVMPGFEAIKFVMEDTTMPKKEVTTIDSSGSYLQVKTTIKDGIATVPLVYVTDTTGVITAPGQSATKRLATSSTTTLTYNASASANMEYDGFVVSYASSRDSESYYLDVVSVRQDSDMAANVTTIKNKLTGDTWSDRKAGDTITLGNVVLTVNNVTYIASSSTKEVSLGVNSGGSFNTLYTAEGLKIWLPYEINNLTTPNKGALASPYTGNTSLGYNGQVWTLWMQEKDKDGTVANGNIFNFTITNSSSGSTFYTTVDNVYGDGTAYETPTSASKIWESYVTSDLATKLLHDKTATSPAQYSASVEYHGGQVYANVYVAAPSVTTTGGAAKVKVVKDSEVDSVSSKNLIVVGGSCINTVAATLLGSTTPLCGADFATKTNAAAGQYLIQTFASPYNSAKVAMLVAGYDAAETTAAVAKVKDGSADPTVGKSMVGPTAS